MPPVHLPYLTPHYPHGNKMPFSQYDPGSTPVYQGGGKEFKSKEDRQRWFEREIRRMAEHVDGGLLPWAFRFEDSGALQLDRGCVSMAIANDVIRRPLLGTSMDRLELLPEGETNDPAETPQQKPFRKRLQESRAAVLRRGVTPEHVREAARYIDAHPPEDVMTLAGTTAWARDSFVMVDGRRYPAKILGVIAKRLATQEVLGAEFTNTHTVLRALRGLGYAKSKVSGEELEAVAAELEHEGAFSPQDEDDARERVTRTIVQRRGQAAFRGALLQAYGGRCALTGCDLPDVLEAAHIKPHLGDKSNHVTNGLLLRADIHTLFDLHLVAFDPETYTVRLSAEIAGNAFAAALRDCALRAPKDRRCLPSAEALRWRLARLR